MVHKGFVAIFKRELDRARITECVASWLKRFEKVEQVMPGQESTLKLEGAGEVMWDRTFSSG